jgi:hypothetical protein
MYLRGNSLGTDGPDQTRPDQTRPDQTRHPLNLSIHIRMSMCIQQMLFRGRCSCTYAGMSIQKNILSDTAYAFFDHPHHHNNHKLSTSTVLTRTLKRICQDTRVSAMTSAVMPAQRSPAPLSPSSLIPSNSPPSPPPPPPPPTSMSSPSSHEYFALLGIR